MTIEKYPRDSDIEEHKDRLWTAIIQYFSGYVPIENVSQTLRSLMGDGALWVYNNHKEIDLEEVKKLIATLRIGEK